MNLWDILFFSTLCDFQEDEALLQQQLAQQAAQTVEKAGLGMIHFGEAVIDIAGRAYQSEDIPRELVDGLAPALLFAAAGIGRMDGGLTPKQLQLVQLYLSHFPGQASLPQLRQAIGSGAPLAQSFPVGFLTESGCGPFWRALYRCCKKAPVPSAELQKALTPFDDFLVHFCLVGRTRTRAESLSSLLTGYARAHLADPENNAVPDPDLFGDGRPEDHMARFEQIYRRMADQSGIRAEMSAFDQILPLCKAKTLADLVSLGEIPAAAGIAELEFYFAQYGVQLEIDAKTFLLCLRSRDETGCQIAQITEVQGGEAPQFWKTCQYMCLKAGETMQLLELVKAYLGFVMSLEEQLRRKYPRAGYTREKARQLTAPLLETLAVIFH